VEALVSLVAAAEADADASFAFVMAVWE